MDDIEQVRQADPGTYQKHVATNPNTNLVTSQAMTSSTSKIQKAAIFGLVSFVYFLTWCCVALWAPFFPGEAAKRGVSSTEVGFIFGIYSLVSFFSSLIYGSFVIPRIGPRQVLFGGLILNGGSFIIGGSGGLIQDRLSFTTFCFMVRALGAIGGSGCETSILVILIQEFPERSAFIMGLLGVFTGIGFMLGPVMGGVLYTLGGFRLPMVVIGGILLASVPFIWVLFRNRNYATKEDHKGNLALFKQVIAIPGIVMMIMTSTIMVISMDYLEPILQPHAEMFGLGPAGVSLLFLVKSTIYSLSCPVAGYIISKKPWCRTFLFIGLLGSAVGTLFVGPAPFLAPFLPKKEVWLLVVSLICSATFNGLQFIPVLPEMLHCCQERGIQNSLQLNSLVSGLFYGFVYLGAFLASVVGGTLNDHYGFPWSATIISFLSAGQALVVMTFFICNRRGSTSSINTPEKEKLINKTTESK